MKLASVSEFHNKKLETCPVCDISLSENVQECCPQCKSDLTIYRKLQTMEKINHTLQRQVDQSEARSIEPKAVETKKESVSNNRPRVKADKSAEQRIIEKLIKQNEMIETKHQRANAPLLSNTMAAASLLIGVVFFSLFLFFMMEYQNNKFVEKFNTVTNAITHTLSGQTHRDQVGATSLNSLSQNSLSQNTISNTDLKTASQEKTTTEAELMMLRQSLNLLENMQTHRNILMQELQDLQLENTQLKQQLKLLQITNESRLKESS